MLKKILVSLLLAATFSAHAAVSTTPAAGPSAQAALAVTSGATFPGSPVTGDLFVITDDTVAGACDSAGGSARTLCRWNGSAWQAIGDGTSVGGGDASTNTASSVDNEMVLFNSTTGKSIKRAAFTGLVSLTSGVAAAYGGASCTNQAMTALSSSGGATCASIGTAFISDNAVTLAKLATQAANTILANTTSGAAVPTATAVSSCSTSSSALTWTTNTGPTCNTSINAATLGGATFASPGAIGGGTPGAGTFTTGGFSTSLNIPHSTTLPGTCAVGDQYMDTDATSGQRHYLCESLNTWALQGGGGGGGGTPGGSSGDIQVNTAGSFAGITPGTGVATGLATNVNTTNGFVTPAGNVATATALAANGSNCSTGQAPLGVNASGAVESCTDYMEEPASSGLVARTAANTAAARTITGTSNEITITNGDGVSGNPTLSLSSVVDLGGKALEVPNGTSPPGTCTVGQVFADTDDTTRNRLKLCETTNTWVTVGPASGGGSGDVVGPSSATDGHVALFDTGTGKLIKDGGAFVEAGTLTDTKICKYVAGSPNTIVCDTTAPSGAVVGTTDSQALTNKSINGLTVTSSTGTLTIANSKTATISNTLTFTGTDSSSIAFGAGGTVAYTANNLGAFGSTTSAQLATTLSDEVGSGGGFTRANGSTMDSLALTTKVNLPSVTAFPGSPATGDVVIVTDDSAVGACDSAAGSAVSICRYNGSAWAKLGDGTAAGGALSSSDIDTLAELNTIVGDDDVAGLAAAQTFATGTKTVNTLFNFTGGTLRIPNSTTLPGTCTTGDSYMDTDATSGQRFYLCESSNTWVKQGDGTGGGGSPAGSNGDIQINNTGSFGAITPGTGVATGLATAINTGAGFVTTTGSATLTNKTLTAPVISTISNTGTLTLPTSTDTLTGKATTDTFTNKTLDCAGTGNVCKQKGYIYLTHPHLCDGTNAAIQTTATAISYGHGSFSNSVDQATNYCEYYLMVPEDIDTSVALRGRIKILLGNADTGSHRYVLSSVSVADSAVPTSSTLANAVNIDFAGDGSGASGDVETSAWTTLTSWNGALTAGQTWRIRFARDGDTSDSSTVNSVELGLTIEYGITQ